MFRPMLSATIEDVNDIRFPVLASPKLDGIRATVVNGVLLSRNGKLIPNAHVQAQFGRHTNEGLDGELIVGEPTAADCFRQTTSAVMSRDGQPKVRFFVFDLVSLGMYDARLHELHRYKQAGIVPLPHVEVLDLDTLLALEHDYLHQGYEGLMLRKPTAPYKQGRSTMKEQGLMKLKRFMDSEAEVIGVEERMHNANEATIDALGYTERSSHRENLFGRGDLGALLVRDLKTGIEFNIGSGFDDQTRKELWESPPVGQIAKYKYFPTGSKDKPRFPVFLGFRYEGDL